VIVFMVVSLERSIMSFGLLDRSSRGGLSALCRG
jgi:hypothetical protein